MTKEEFIQFDQLNVKRMGHYTSFSNPKIQERRKKRIGNVTPQFLELVEALKNEGLRFMCFENVRRNKKIMPFITDIVLPDFNILIRFWDKDNYHDLCKRQSFFGRTKRWAYPFFVEREDTIEFTLEKLANCIADALANPKQGIRTRIEKQRRPRIEKINNKKEKNYGHRKRFQRSC